MLVDIRLALGWFSLMVSTQLLLCVFQEKPFWDQIESEYTVSLPGLLSYTPELYNI